MWFHLTIIKVFLFQYYYLFSFFNSFFIRIDTTSSTSYQYKKNVFIYEMLCLVALLVTDPASSNNIGECDVMPACNNRQVDFANSGDDEYK